MHEKQFNISIGHKQHLACFFYPPRAKTFPVLVAVHGFSTNHTGTKIQELARELPKKGWGIVTCDLRFHGKSSGKIEDIDVAVNVEDVRALVTHAFNISGEESVSLYGSSYGGMLAIVAAIEFPMIQLLGLVAPVTDFVVQLKKTMPLVALEQWKKRGHHEYRVYESDLP